MFKLEIETGNDAFSDDSSYEIARILRAIAKKVENGILDGKVVDINGNACGIYRSE